MEGIDYNLVFAFIGGVSVLLIMILALRVNAFMSLLVASITVGLISGMRLMTIVDTVIQGMGSTLGFVATIVGLGAIFGEILRQSGSTEKLSNAILKTFGLQRSPMALSLSGFLIAIPVFFDVAFIILVPVLYALQKKTGRSLLYFAIPLLASLAVTHAFIPPTPGPIAVADIINAELGWVILFGFIVGLPTTIVAGLIFGKFIARRIHVEVPTEMEIEQETREGKDPNLFVIISLISLPILLILCNTFIKAYDPNVGMPSELAEMDNISNVKSMIFNALYFLGHPIVALILSTLLASYLLGTRLGFSKKQLQEMSIKALGPAGIIILITGAGGVFKQMLIASGAGKMLAEQFTAYDIAPILMAFIVALIIRLVQGSATVAMITSAGIMGPILEQIPTSPIGLALIVLSIAAGASGFSHVNDSGFWLVNRYLGISETDTLKSWTVMTGILSLTALCIILVLNAFVA